MKKLSLSSFAIVVSLLLTVSAFAIEFSSDMVTTASGQRHSSKIYMQGKKFRMESPEQPGYNIMRSDKNVMWMVMPEQKSYMEMKIDPSKQPRTEEKVEGEVSRKLIGSETIDGRGCDKYEITYKDRENTTRMHQWMAKDIKFPVKMAAVDGSWIVEYKNIKMGNQPDSLFEVPAGYAKMGMPSMRDALQGNQRNEVGAAPADNQPPEVKEEEGGSSSGGILKKLPKLPLPKLPRW
jgi:outer membrane lipoprotein-sorting protein